MPRDPKPWFRSDRDAWFVTINGRRYNLGPERDAAHDRFHELMLNGGEGDGANGAVTVFALFDDFLEWTKAQRAENTYNWYFHFLDGFSTYLATDRNALRLKPIDVVRWVSKHPKWSSTYQRDCIRAIQRSYRWAHRNGLIDRNPLQFIDKPPANRREEILTVDEYRTVLTEIRSKQFKTLIEVAWETGARPQELTRVKVRHVDLQNARWVFPPAESKGKRRHRIIYLNADALRITREALTTVKKGPLFRNRAGRPWHPWAISCQFTRLKERINRRLCLYVFRHSFATRMLTAGVDAMTVATLLGHADASMLGRVYQHLAQCPQHLLDKLNSVTAPTNSE
jgi:integrase